MGLATTDILKNLSNTNSDLKKMSSAQLKKLQKTLLLMMKDFDRVCRDKGIDYMLGGGSCLGAVRHDGFIPWDDDMDLNISRKDFEKFKAVFPTTLGDKYWLHFPEKKENYGLATVTIRRKGTLYRGPSDLEKSPEDGIFIDLCVIENTYDFKPMRLLHGFLSSLLGLVVSCRRFFRHRRFYIELAGKDKKARKVFRVKIALGFLVAWLPVNYWAKIWNSVNKMCKNETSKYVVIPTGRKHFFGEMYERESYCKLMRHKFEDAKFLISKDYDAYMRHMYGDNYMEIPDKSKREAHVFTELDFGDL